MSNIKPKRSKMAGQPELASAGDLTRKVNAGEMREEIALLPALQNLIIKPPEDPEEILSNHGNGENITSTSVVLALGTPVASTNFEESVQGIMFDRGAMLIINREFDDPDAQDFVEDKKRQIIQKLRAKVRNRKAAKQPRKAVTREMLEQFRDDFIKKYRQARGWQTAAIQQFQIDRKTLKQRLQE